jgi:hypothetical protein
LVHFPNIVFNGLINKTVELCLKRLQNSQGIVIGFSSAGGGSSLNFSNCPREKRISYGIINGGYMYSSKMKMTNKKVPIALSIFLWHKLFCKKKIIYYIDNMAVVSVLNSKTSTSARVMILLRLFFYWSSSF